MRVVFAGTPPFAVRALEALHDAGHDIALVLTQPDRPAGRGMKLASSPVADAAGSRGLAIAKPISLKNPEIQALLEATSPDVIVVAAFGLILPKSVLAIPRCGCLNIHASLLPRWRGAAPVQRAILAGDRETGISIMQMETGLDTGPVYLERRLVIAPQDTAGTLTDRLAAEGAIAIVEALARLDALHPVPQDPALACYAAKVDKKEGTLDWHLDSLALERQVRAFNPFPGAETAVGTESLKIWAAVSVDARGEAGTVIGLHQGCPVVAAGSGALALTVIQRPGSKRLAATEFLKARPMPIGTRLGDCGK